MMNKEQNLNDALTNDKAEDILGFFGRNSIPKLKLTKTWKSFTVNFFEGTRFRIWLYISKYKKEPLHFCLIIGSVISLDTAHVGKRICGRLNLTRFFNKDFHVYTSEDSVVSSNNNTENKPMNKPDVRGSFLWKLKIILLSPLWFFSTSPTRKTWKEFKSGLIKHECKYDYSKPCYDNGKYYKCEHLGCNIVSVRNEDGSWC